MGSQDDEDLRDGSSGNETGGEGERDGDMEHRILDAAHAIFVRQGTVGARMQEIADEARVNKALLHYYFRTKERLARAVFQRVARRTFPPLLEILNSDIPLEEKVERFVDWETTRLSQSPLLPGYMAVELHNNLDRVQQFVTMLTGVELDAVAGEVLDKIGKQIDERVRAGVMRPIPPDQFVINLISLCVFPYVARPVITMALGISESQFHAMMQQRRTEVVEFFLNALRV